MIYFLERNGKNMAANVNTEHYENLITALKQFATSISASAQEMLDAGKVALENMDDDDHCVKKVEEISRCVTAFEACADQAIQLANMMQEELDDILGAGN